MANVYVYQIVGEVMGDVNVIKNNHFVDVGQGCHTSRACTNDFLATAKANGLSPMCVSGNDGFPTCGQTGGESCSKALADAGWMAEGGESTDANEVAYAQKYHVFETWGGSYGPGDLDPFSPWRIGAGPFPNMFAYLEPYTDYTMYDDVTINVCNKAWDLGCKEVGVLVAIGKGNLDDYIKIANGVIRDRGKFSGFCFWNGCGSVLSDTINSMMGIVQGLQRLFPPDNRTIDVRLKGGVAPTPTPTPIPPKPKPTYHSQLFDLLLQ